MYYLLGLNVLLSCASWKLIIRSHLLIREWLRFPVVLNFIAVLLAVNLSPLGMPHLHPFIARKTELN